MRILPVVFCSLACAAVSAEAAKSGGRANMSVDVDLTEAPRRLFHAHLKLPAAKAYVYPKWVPGEHGPTGPIKDLAGLVFTSGGRTLAWHRDDADMYRFIVDGASGEVDVQLDLLSAPPSESGFSQGASATANLAMLSWNQVLLYPEGLSPRDITVRPSVKLPQGWKSATALERAGDGFSETTLEMLVDSPVLSGAHLREVPIGTAGGAPHFADFAAETEEELQLAPETKASLERLVAEANGLFGAHHYRAYHFLITLSDSVAHFGLEHHQSSDDRLAGRTLVDKEKLVFLGSLLPHEYTHSWNGKHRRPAGLATPEWQQPMKGELLWVYEGLTQYLGHVLTSRAGFWNEPFARDAWASVEDEMVSHGGRAWRPLQDTTVGAQILYEARSDWNAWRRGVDFYDEGQLLWLEVDSIIREKTAGKRSLDDFCKRFHGGASGGPEVRPYSIEDILTTLNEVAPYDWRAHFAERVERIAVEPPPGLARSGWRVTYSDQESDYLAARQKTSKFTDLRASIGISIDVEKGTVIDIIRGKAADKAGMGPSMRLIAVNGRKYSDERLKQAIVARGPLELLVENAESYRTYALDYRDGLRYPHLQRLEGRPDFLTAILSQQSAH